ncbi:MAG: YbgA family protein [Candidatus Bipolaricaulia bacterium]
MVHSTRTNTHVSIGSFLSGEQGRHGDGPKHDRRLTQDLTDYFAWVRVFPDGELGLGAPRKASSPVHDAVGAGMQASEMVLDRPDDISEDTRRRVEAGRSSNLRGCILEKDSPTYGMARMSADNDHNRPECLSVGPYGQSLLAEHPNLPIDEEERLSDPALRENFVTRVFAYDRWVRLRNAGAGARDLVDFHTRHKTLVLAHQPAALKQLGRLVAHAGQGELASTLDEYESAFMQALANVATRKRHVNALQHLAGFLKRSLDGDEKSELHGVISDYARGWVPLVAPVTLLKHHLRRLGPPWASAQLYLEPYPQTLRLRNQI